ncbi:globin family protein [Mangrovibacterium lignilyticum]|uniref:hypothetical protein n=1 Tax=Mangrovibacterium lignilyticum TaxID=2668052 RepID=UPI0013D55CE0|nr:hypothetical protein [Mangrovibacterium lignilyticum]
MTDTDIQLVQKTYPKLKVMAPRLAKYFYNRIAELDSTLESLFQADSASNGAAFAELLDQGVASIEDPKSLLPEIKKLEAKLTYYNIKADCLNTIGVVFVDTLAFGFGNEFNAQIQNPWVNAYKEYAALFFAE